jgi:hypothetical protein
LLLLPDQANEKWNFLLKKVEFGEKQKKLHQFNKVKPNQAITFC